jgi:hypothetical protein
MQHVDFRTAAPDEITSAFLHRGCVLLRNFVDTAALTRAYDLMVKAYDQVKEKHVHPHHLRDIGLPMYSDILFTERHHDLLKAVFGARGYSVSDHTASRRTALVVKPPYWGRPLAPHIDAFLLSLELTVNFWIPFQECGVDAPSLGVIEAPFGEIVSFTGYQNGEQVWDDPEKLKLFSRFKPEMMAMTRFGDPARVAEMRERFHDRIRTPSFAPGDAMMLSNWTLHFTHTTPSMTKDRENLELRFASSASLDEILRDHGIDADERRVA